MHTTKCVSGTIFHHNGDFSGDVVICRDGKELTIPMADVLALAAKYIGQKAAEMANDDAERNVPQDPPPPL